MFFITLSDLSNFPSAKVSDIFDGLITKRILRPSDMDCSTFFLSYGRWRKICPHASPLALSGVGIQMQSTLTLNWKRRGGARTGMKSLVNWCCQSCPDSE